MTSPKILDKNWLRQSFMLAPGTMDDEDILRRSTSKGYHKFSDNTLGGGQAINPLPQFSRYTDLKEERLLSIDDQESPSGGLGRWQSENIEDNGVYIHVRCGNPAFNSSTAFFGSFMNSQASSLARTGKTNEFFYALGSAAGFVVSWYMAPVIWVGTLYDILLNKPKTKYYYLRPAMTSYWSAIQNIMNTIMVNKGMLLNQQPGEDLITPSEVEVNYINNLLPDIFTRNGQFDVYNVATRYQRRANKLYRELAQIRARAANPQDLDNKERSYIEGGGFLSAGDRQVSLTGYVEDYMGRPSTNPDELGTVTTVKSTETDGGPDGAAEQANSEVKVGLFEDITESLTSYLSPETLESLVAELNDGGQFITFKVDNPGAIGESFSTSVKESTVASTLNSTSQTARDFRFNFADGNLVGGMIGDTIGAVVGAGQAFVAGIADSLSVSGVASLFGNALVDIPKYWDNSTAQLPRMNYSLQLRQTYGHDLSAVQDMWFQVAALLAMTLPLSTGSQSYTQPFLCEVYCPGRAQSQLCMVDSLSISRGEGSKGWTPGDAPTGVNINISFVDLSSIMHMPITAGFNPLSMVFSPQGIANMLAGDEGAFNDYLATISGLGIAEQIYPLRKLKRNYHLGQAQMNSWLSPSHLASWVGGSSLGRVASGLFAATDKV